MVHKPTPTLPPFKLQNNRIPPLNLDPAGINKKEIYAKYND